MNSHAIIHNVSTNNYQVFETVREAQAEGKV
jgi:hypothetical protein